MKYEYIKRRMPNHRLERKKLKENKIPQEIENSNSNDKKVKK